MAKVFKITTYIVDAMDEHNESSLEDLLEYCCQNDVSLRHTTINESDIGEWDDDCVYNHVNCSKDEFDKLFV